MRRVSSTRLATGRNTAPDSCRTATDSSATLTIEFQGPGTLWLDNASLMPVDSIGGWRKDVVEAVREERPGIIRFGGSTLDDPNLGDFEWRDTIGDPDRRRPFRAWGGLQPTGPGMEEFVQFCRTGRRRAPDLRPVHSSQPGLWPPNRSSTSTAESTRPWAACAPGTVTRNPITCGTGKSVTSRLAPITRRGCPPFARP